MAGSKSDESEGQARRAQAAEALARELYNAAAVAVRTGDLAGLRDAVARYGPAVAALAPSRSAQPKTVAWPAVPEPQRPAPAVQAPAAAPPPAIPPRSPASEALGPTTARSDELAARQQAPLPFAGQHAPPPSAATAPDLPAPAVGNTLVPGAGAALRASLGLPAAPPVVRVIAASGAKAAARQAPLPFAGQHAPPPPAATAPDLPAPAVGDTLPAGAGAALRASLGLPALPFTEAPAQATARSGEGAAQRRAALPFTGQKPLPAPAARADETASPPAEIGTLFGARSPFMRAPAPHPAAPAPPAGEEALPAPPEPALPDESAATAAEPKAGAKANLGSIFLANLGLQSSDES